MSHNIDHSTLNWVKEEIDETLKQARHALEEYVENPGDITQLRFTYNYVHQVHGTLKMVELFGAAMLTDESEKLTQALIDGVVANKEQAYENLMRAIIQLPDYLEKIQSGLRDDPMLLLPLINEVRSSRGESAIAEHSLFVNKIDTTIEVPVQRVEQDIDSQQLAKKSRHNFQIGLLGFYRNQDTKGSLEKILKVLRELERSCQYKEVVKLWWISTGLVEALLEEQVGPSVALNKLLGQVDREVKRLIDRGEKDLLDNPSENLLSDLLYYLARSNAQSPRVLDIRSRFNLQNAVPDQGALDAARRTLSGPNIELLETVSVAVREYLTQVKDTLDLFLRSDRKNVGELARQVDIMQKVADTLGILGLGEPRKVVLDQIILMQRITQGDVAPTDIVLMDIAHALLQVETALDALAKQKRAPDAASVSSQSLNVTGAQGVLVDQIAVNMVKIKDAILAYIDAPTEHQLLENVPRLFNEVTGAMHMVNMEQPARILSAVNQYVSQALLGKKRKPEQEELDSLADAIASIEYYLEALPQNPQSIAAMLKVAYDAVQKLGYPADGPESELTRTKKVSAPEFDEQKPASASKGSALVESIDQISFETVEPESQNTPSDATAHLELTPLEEPVEEIEITPPAPPPVAVESKQEKQARLKAASVRLLADVDDDILSIFVEEAREELETIQSLLPVWRQNTDDVETLTRIRRSFHTLKGSGRLVGATDIGEFAWSFENMLNRVLDHSVKADLAMIKLVESASMVLPALINAVESNGSHDVDVDNLSERAFAIVNQAKAARAKAVVKSTPVPTRTPEIMESTHKGKLPILDKQEKSKQEKFKQEAVTPIVDVMDPVLYDIFSKESAGHLSEIHQFLKAAHAADGPAIISDVLIRSLHTLHGSARMAGSISVAEIAGLLEKYIKAAISNAHPVHADGLKALAESVQLIETLLTQINKATPAIPEYSALLERLQVLHKIEIEEEHKRHTQESVHKEPVTSKPQSAAHKKEESAEYDLELMEVFLEEGTEILDSSEAILKRLKKAPSDQGIISELQRELHTLKGGARMAGIAAIGDLSHAVESLLTDIAEGQCSSNAQTVAALHSVLDRLFKMLEMAQHRAVVQAAPDLIALIEGLRSGTSVVVPPAVKTPSPVESEVERSTPQLVESSNVPMAPIDFPVAPALRKAVRENPKPTETVRRVMEDAKTAAATAQDAVRVRADLLDHLVNFAGEVSIYRSRLEQQNSVFTQNLGEMGNTVVRLHEQLRKLEIETEAQVLYRHEKEGGNKHDFDPLEMDRYSRVQELSRGLSESLNDVTSIKGQLDNLIRESETLLLQQSRVNTDLQEGLMRTRMVPFAQIEPRLRRLLRQTCQELGKQAELEVVGEQGEMDRTVLDRIIAPLEHLLRNAVAHGIETPDKRKALNKDTTGKIAIVIARQGSEIMIRVTDDGSGINLKAIHKKAIERGLLDRNAEVSDHDIMQYILESGFSTAETVTQISGRGVGMDVVNSEIKQLGGALDIDSKLNEGTQFTIHLPLTLAVNHALLLVVGEELYAMPLSGIEGIIRVPKQEIEKQLDAPDGSHTYGGNKYHVRRLSSLLSSTVVPSTEKVMPVLLIRSGDYRVALQVDALQGSREIVVKSIGPQLSTVRGISGATILGDGRVVLILDMGALIRLSAATRTQANLQRMRVTSDGAAAEAKKTVVMVVDDSITVRKVTTRLLERNDMVVITAKDGVDAVAQLAEQIPDIMLLDIEMPRMDGFELAAYIRNEPKLKHLPIIMITSRTGDKHRNRAAELGVNRYLGKPYQEFDLLADIKDLLKDRYGNA